METFTFKDLEKFCEELFVSEGNPPIIIMTPELYEQYEKEWVERDKLYDAVYVAAMCKADYFGKSVPDERHLLMFVKDMIDDPDAEEGFIFNRFYADTMFMNDPVDWDDMI